MPKATPITIVNVGYRSTSYWVVSAGTGCLLVDIGWPGTLGTMKANLRRMGVPLHKLRYALATHYHIDHAGLAEELKREGVPLLVLDVQADAIPIVKTWTKPRDNYVDITPDGNVTISIGESRQLLGEIGIHGEILHTPGHTDHCVSLLLDDGSVFTGDLPLMLPSSRCLAIRWSRPMCSRWRDSGLGLARGACGSRATTVASYQEEMK